MSEKNIPITYEGEGPLIQPIDLDGFREWNRNKSKKLDDKLMGEDAAIEKFVKSGDYIGFELYGTVRAPISMTRALIRSGKKDFRIVGQGVHELDLLLGANRVTEVDFTYIGQEVFGVSSVVRRRFEKGDVKKVTEWSNAAITWRFKAAAMGVPFVPCRSMLGTDTLKKSAAKVIKCPFTGDTLALLPALIVDVAFIHVARADKHGNCQIDGISGFAAEIARASKRVIISAEEIVDTEVIRSQPDRTIIPYYLVDAVVHAPYGSWPGEMANYYERDDEHYNLFLSQHKTEDTTQSYLKEWVYDLPSHQALVDKVGLSHLQKLHVKRG